MIILTDELLLKYQRCHRHTFLEFYGDRQFKAKEKDFCQKLKYEKNIFSQELLTSYNLPYQQPKIELSDSIDLIELAKKTEQLMSKGIECIYEGVIKTEFQFSNNDNVIVISSPTLLIKENNKKSRWGNWNYYPVNINLGKNQKKEYKIISALQAEILKQIQGVTPSKAEIVLRNRRKHYHIQLAVWIPQSIQLVKECALMLKQEEKPDIFISRQRCSLCSWYNNCYTIAKSTQHISLIPGITPIRYQMLKQIGIDDFSSLSSANLSILETIFTKDIAETIYQQTLSLKSNRSILKQDCLPTIPDDRFELYFDIETEPDRQLHYLLGILLVDRQKGKEKYYKFLATSAKEEKKNWHEFLKFLDLYPNSPIFHYSEYEVETIKYLANLYHTPSSQVQSVLNRSFDLYKCVRDYFYLPLENYSLKSIANWLGFFWRNPETGNQYNYDSNNIIAGDQCVYWYHQWLTTNNQDYLDYILIYNHDDCWATYELKKWLTIEWRMENGEWRI